jgi:hypothetical protein
LVKHNLPNRQGGLPVKAIKESEKKEVPVMAWPAKGSSCGAVRVLLNKNSRKLSLAKGEHLSRERPLDIP